MWRFFHFRNVPMITQPTMASCWYASAQMVVNSFMDGPLIGMGPRNPETFKGGLPPEDIRAFATDNYFSSMHASEPDLMRRASRNNGFVFDDLVRMLSTYGPLWTPTDYFWHPCTVTGIETVTGIKEDDSDTWITYNDPLGGAIKRVSLPVFNENRLWAKDKIWDILHYNGQNKGISNKVGGQYDIWLRIRPTIGIHKLNVDIPGRRTTSRPQVLRIRSR